MRSRKRNIAALAHDNLIPATKRFDEEMIFDGDLIFPLISKRDYGEELGSDIIYEDARDKNDRKDCAFYLVLYTFSCYKPYSIISKMNVLPLPTRLV